MLKNIAFSSFETLLCFIYPAKGRYNANNYKQDIFHAVELSVKKFHNLEAQVSKGINLWVSLFFLHDRY